MKSRLKKVVSVVLSALFTTILIISISIFAKGMYLFGLPDISQVQKVTISYPDVCNEMKEITDDEHMELAVKLTGFLRYSVFEKYAGDDKPMITITYFLTNGNEISVSASRETVWWKGKAHVLHDKGMFVNLTEGIFFLEDLAEE